MLRVSTTARLLIASQAPGTKVHISGTPWTDASGDRLRGWLGMTKERFYDGRHIAAPQRTWSRLGLDGTAWVAGSSPAMTRAGRQRLEETPLAPAGCSP